MTRWMVGMACALFLAGAGCLGDDDDGNPEDRPDAGNPDDSDASSAGAPTANAGADATAFALADVQLDGSGSVDPDGDPLTFTWTQTAGDAVQIIGGDTATPRFAAPAAAGTLTFELAVSDGAVGDTDSVDVVVEAFAGELPSGGDQSPFSRGANLLTQGRDVVAQGRYLYVADGSAGLRILDLADPTAPVRAAIRDTPGSAMDVAIAGNHVYIADLAAGLQIIDARDYLAEAADPAAPQIVGSAAIGGNAHGVAVAGNYAFVVNDLGLAIVDVGEFVADAADPTATVVTQVNTPGFAFEVVVDGAFLYVSDRGDGPGDVGGLRIFDISEYLAGTPAPADPPNVGNWQGGGVYGAAIVGDYAFVCQNNTNVLDSRGFLRVIDIADKAAPFELDGTALDTAGTPRDVHLAGDLLYVIASSNVEVVDVADYAAGTPAAGPPVSVAVYPTRGSSQGFVRHGDFGYSVAFTGTPDVIVLNLSEVGNPQAVGRVSTTESASDIELAGDYAFVSFGNDFVLAFDVSDPASPVLPAGGTIAQVVGGAELAVAGDHLFVAGSLPLEVLDISAFVAGTPDPARPEIVATLDEWPQSTSDVVVRDGLAFMPIPLNGVQIVDVSDPTNPSVPAGGTAGMHTRASLTEVVAEGTRLYVAGTGGIEVVDVTDPAAPVSLGGDDTIGFPSGLAVRDQIAYAAVTPGGLFVIDLTDPAAPVRLGNLPSSMSGVVLDGDRAYVQAGSVQKTAVVDIRDPANMAVVAGYGTSSSVAGMRVRGDLVHAASFGGYESFRFGSAALVGSATASPGASVALQLVWSDATSDLEVACEAPIGSTCVVSDHDRIANTATVTWTVPSAPGQYALRAVVGDSIAYTNALGRIRVQ